MMLSILLLRWQKSLEVALGNTRFRGLMKFIGG